MVGEVISGNRPQGLDLGWGKKIGGGTQQLFLVLEVVSRPFVRGPEHFDVIHVGLPANIGADRPEWH